jgi:hypothetical protein
MTPAAALALAFVRYVNDVEHEATLAELREGGILPAVPPGFEGAYFGCEDDCAPD